MQEQSIPSTGTPPVSPVDESPRDEEVSISPRALYTIIAILVLIVLAFAAYFAWDYLQTKDSDTSSSTTTTTEITTTTD